MFRNLFKSKRPIYYKKGKCLILTKLGIHDTKPECGKSCGHNVLLADTLRQNANIRTKAAICRAAVNKIIYNMVAPEIPGALYRHGENCTFGGGLQECNGTNCDANREDATGKPLTLEMLAKCQKTVRAFLDKYSFII